MVSEMISLDTAFIHTYIHTTTLADSTLALDYRYKYRYRYISINVFIYPIQSACILGNVVQHTRSGAVFPNREMQGTQAAARQAPRTHLRCIFQTSSHHFLFFCFYPYLPRPWAELPLLGMPFLCSSSFMPCHCRRRPRWFSKLAYDGQTGLCLISCILID